MDKAERETHDFMNVDSFSQLPFIRPAPPPKEKGIRLFGIEFGDTPPISAAQESESADTTTNENSNNNLENNNSSNNNNGESSRRFECHYCCRNFPTSQALGGHQNAHKRERQHAKRQHLQSAMVHGSLAEGHHQVYGFMNYRFGSFGSSPTMAAYPTWNNSSHNNTGVGRFYGTSSSYSSSSSSSHHQQPPINGNPLSVWRIPNGGGGGGSNNPILGRERGFPLLAGEEVNARIGATTRVELSPNNNNGSQNGYVYDSKTSVSDHVSLDLHL